MEQSFSDKKKLRPMWIFFNKITMEQSLTTEHLFILQLWLRLKWLFYHDNHQESCHIGFHTQILPSLSPVNTHLVLTSMLVTGAAKKAPIKLQQILHDKNAEILGQRHIFKKEMNIDMLSLSGTKILVQKKNRK